jgi:hypothetical protein
MIIVAVFLPLAGLVLSLLLILWVMYANAFRGLYYVWECVTRGCSSCQTAKPIPAEDLIIVPSIRMQGVQVQPCDTRKQPMSQPGAKEFEMQQLDIEAAQTGAHGKILNAATC